MSQLIGTLVPLVLGGAIVPIQIIITILLLRSPKRVLTAAAFVAGMSTVRLLQGLVFGLVLTGTDTGGSESTGPGPVIGGVLVALALVMYATVLKQLLTHEDPDAPPPKWITMTETMPVLKAFGIGAALIAIGPKFWVFTLGAIGAIGDAELSRTESILTFLGFAVATVIIHLVILAVAAIAPTASASALDASANWLKAHNRIIVIVLGVVFGTWFLLKGLNAFGAI